MPKKQNQKSDMERLILSSLFENKAKETSAQKDAAAELWDSTPTASFIQVEHTVQAVPPCSGDMRKDKIFWI